MTSSFSRALAIVILMIAATLSAATAQAIAVGDTVSNVLRVAGKDVPLPSGVHTVIGVGFAGITQPEYGARVNPDDYGPIRRIVLVRADGGIVGDAVEVVVNTLPHPDGWGTSTDCGRTDIYATLVGYKSGWDVSCMWMQPVAAASPPIDAATNATADADETPLRQVDGAVLAYALQNGLVMPDLMVEAGFRVANRHDTVEVRYQFAAMADGVAVSGGGIDGWLPRNIAATPGPLAKVQTVAAWASSIYPSVEQGLRLPIDADASFASPFDDVQFTGKSTDRAQRLAKLTVLRESGALTAAEFERQKAIIEAEAEPVLENAWTYSTVAGYKAFTYRVMVTTINAGIDYIFIGQPFAAGVLVILQVFVNTTKFFFHEVMWQELFGVGPLQREQPRVMDFTVASAAN